MRRVRTSVKALFGRLRRILRLRHGELLGRQPGPPPSPVDSVALLYSPASPVSQSANSSVRAPRQAGKAGTSAESAVLSYLDRCRGQLFMHPVFRSRSGRLVAVIVHTNNPAEHSFPASFVTCADA